MAIRVFLLFFLTIFAGAKNAFAISEDSDFCQESTVISPIENNLLEKITPLWPNPGPFTNYSAVYGKDNRTLMKTEYPWRAIGKLAFNGKGHCTATLISSCHIVTASHCLGKANGTPHDLEKLTFQASNNGPISNVLSYSRGRFERLDQNDWAVVKLEKPIGDQVGWLGVKNLTGPEQDYKGKHIIAGYNGDLENKGERATVDDDVYIRFHHSNSKNLIFHNGNTFSGSSGAAIFQFDENNRPWVVGINTKAILLSDGNRIRQIYFRQEPADWKKLATGVSTNEFWNEMLLFIAKNPCDRKEPLPPNPATDKQE
jgi:protease YdgD